MPESAESKECDKILKCSERLQLGFDSLLREPGQPI